MKSEERILKPVAQDRQLKGARWWSRLQTRMTFSYLGVTVFIVLLSELLILLAIVTGLTQSGLLDKVILTTARHTAQVYALEAAAQTSGSTLDTRTTFQPGKPASIALPGGGFVPGGDPSSLIPYIDTQVPYIDPVQPAPEQVLGFALLIAPNGQVLASSYPAGYPASMHVDGALHDQQQLQLVRNAVAGKEGRIITIGSGARGAPAAEPILGREEKGIRGAYRHEPAGPG